jgi:starch phosphorylase
MNVARHMVGGVDVWLNTPRRFLEACGTSGMKVAFNGGINLSVLDGWWDEAYEPELGWAIGKGEVFADFDYQDEVDSKALLDLLEKELIPSFYDRDPHGLPRTWLARMKASMKKLGPVFNINRMVTEYADRLYFPANNRFHQFCQDEGSKAKELVFWKKHVGEIWRKIKIEAVEANPDHVLKVGDDLTVRAWVNLGELASQDVAVQIYQGELDTAGDIKHGEAITMTISPEKRGNLTLFTGKISYVKSGRHGLTVRVLPHHPDLVSPFDTGLILWASESINSSVAV